VKDLAAMFSSGPLGGSSVGVLYMNSYQPPLLLGNKLKRQTTSAPSASASDVINRREEKPM